MQANEERLIGYALDLGVEVKEENAHGSGQLTALKIVKGVIHETRKSQQAKRYLVMNRAREARALLIEHPVRDDWKLVHPEKAAERSREMYRFQRTVPAGKADRLDVIEEQITQARFALGSTSDEQVRVYLSGAVVSPTSAVWTILELFLA